MAILAFVRGKLRRGGQGARGACAWLEDGVAVRYPRPLTEATVDSLLDSADKASAEETFLVAYLSQLVSEGRCHLEVDRVMLPWQLVYDLLRDFEHSASVQSLGLPPERPLRPILD